MRKLPHLSRFFFGVGKFNPKQDYYKTLGIPKTSNKQEVKKAFREMAKRYHPDTDKGS